MYIPDHPFTTKDLTQEQPMQRHTGHGAWESLGASHLLSDLQPLSNSDRQFPVFMEVSLHRCACLHLWSLMRNATSDPSPPPRFLTSATPGHPRAAPSLLHAVLTSTLCLPLPFCPSGAPQLAVGPTVLHPTWEGRTGATSFLCACPSWRPNVWALSGRDQVHSLPPQLGPPLGMETAQQALFSTLTQSEG